MLIHGLFGSLDNLAVIKRGMQDEFNILSVDLPDHGKSFKTKKFDFNSYANYLIDLLSNLHIQQTHIIGHSLGGKIAMRMALDQSELIQKLVIADIAPVRYPTRHQAVLSGLRAVDLQITQDRNHANQQMAQYVIEPGVRQFLLKSLFQTDSGWQWRFNLDLLERDYEILSDEIASDEKFHGPVLFIKGGNSDYLLSEHQPSIMKLFPNSKAKIIQNTGHWLHAEKPQIFNRLAKTFLLD